MQLPCRIDPALVRNLFDVNRDLFGLLFHGPGDLNLQDAVFKGRLDQRRLDFMMKGEGPLERSVKSLPAIVVVFSDMGAGGSLTFKGQNIVLDFYRNFFLADSGQLDVDYNATFSFINVDCP